LVGGISLNSIERGIAQTGTLGYWMGQSFAGKGLMREGTSLVAAFRLRYAPDAPAAG